MRFSAFIVYVCLFSANAIIAQNTTSIDSVKSNKYKKSLNAVFIEFGGNGNFYSFNYDRIFQQAEGFKSSARIGFNLLPLSGDSTLNFAHYFPLEYNMLIGKRRNYFNWGFGFSPILVYTVDDKSANKDKSILRMNEYRLVLRLGYRRQVERKGQYFSIGITPMMTEKGQFVFWAGVSMGKAF